MFQSNPFFSNSTDLYFVIRKELLLFFCNLKHPFFLSKDTVEKLTEEKNELIESSEVKERKIIELQMIIKEFEKRGTNGKGKN